MKHLIFKFRLYAIENNQYYDLKHIGFKTDNHKMTNHYFSLIVSKISIFPKNCLFQNNIEINIK